MTTLYFDCYAGISGDMCVAALLDLGVSLTHVTEQLAKLPLPTTAYELSTSHTERHHLAALSFHVTVHDHHTHRHYADICRMISESTLSESVKSKAGRIFQVLAQAEAIVHQVAIETVHFHEVGAVDSIIDIVATAICLDYLAVDTILASPLPLGSGFVQTAHGRLPVPAPATAELLKQLLVHHSCGSGERVTPTGAAIIAALATPTPRQPAMMLTAIGSGAGSKDFSDCPNIVRAFLGTPPDLERHDEVVVVESNIDDSTPELLGFVMEQLFHHGALDVFFTPIQMKKNRPATQLSFLCQRQQLETLSALLLTETSAIGLRYYPASRIKLSRDSISVATKFGSVRFKRVYTSSGVMRATPEYDDCCRIAREYSIPCREVMTQLSAHDLAGHSLDASPVAGVPSQPTNISTGVSHDHH